MPLEENDLKRFHNTLRGDNPLDDPEHNALYVPRMQDLQSGDPIVDIHRQIEWADSNSVALLTGFRGNGKSTELHRLKSMLERDDGRVILLDMDRYVNMAVPVDITDLLLALLTALAEALKAQSGLDEITQTAWEKAAAFLNQEVEFHGFKLKSDLGVGSAEFGLRLKQEPSVKKLIQERLEHRVADLFSQMDGFISRAVSKLRQQKGDPDLKVVILVDSLEHLRGGPGQEVAMHDAVLRVFTLHADRLRFSAAHMVYTVPPILALRASSADRAGDSPIALWPNIHVRAPSGEPDPDGLARMREIISRRFTDWEAAIEPDQLDALAMASGGDFREFFRLLQSVLRRLAVRGEQLGKPIKADATIIDPVIQQYGARLALTVTQELRKRMRVIREKKQLDAKNREDFESLMDLLDGNLVMNYQNGKTWFDVHPLLTGDDY